MSDLHDGRGACRPHARRCAECARRRGHLADMSSIGSDLAAFLNQPLLAVLATNRRGGEIALNPVWFEYRDVGFSLNSYQSAIWPRRVQRQRGAILLVIDPLDTLRTAHVDADLVGVRREGARDHIDTLSEPYLGHPYRGPPRGSADPRPPARANPQPARSPRLAHLDWSDIRCRCPSATSCATPPRTSGTPPRRTRS